MSSISRWTQAITGAIRNGASTALGSAGKLVTGTNRLLANGIQTLAVPYAQAASSLVGKATRQAMVPLPPPLHALSDGIKHLIEINQPTQNDMQTLKGLIELHKLDVSKTALQNEFPHLSEEDAIKLVALSTALQQPFPEENGVVDIPEQFRKSLRDIAEISQNYGTDTDLPVHTLALRELNQDINADATPVLKEARKALEALLSLPDTTDPEPCRLAIIEVIKHAGHLRFGPQSPRELDASDKLAIEQLMIMLAQNPRHPLAPAIKAKLNEIHRIVMRIYRPMLGLVARTADNATLQLSEGISRLTAHTKESIGSLFSSLPLPSLHSTAPGGGNSAQTPLNSILQSGKQWFNSLMSNAGDALGRQSMRSLATVLEYSFIFIRANLTSNNGTHEQAVKDAIGRSIERIKSAQESGNWTEITQSLGNCFDVFAEYEVYFQDMRIPFKPAHYVSVVPDYLKMARSLEDRPITQPQAITEQMINQMAVRLEKRSCAYITIKAIEQMFGFTLSAVDCSKMLTPDSNTPFSEYSNVFRARFFVFIESLQANSVVKLAAKCTYFMIHACSSLFVHSVMDSVKNDFNDWRIKYPIEKKGKQVFAFARNIFSVMSGAYTSVGQTPAERERDIFVLLNQAIRSPSRNGGLPPQKFFGALLRTALKFVRFNWTRDVGNYFDVCMIPPDSSLTLLNPILDVINLFCKKTLQALVFLPQTAVNFLLQKTTSSLILRSVSLHTLVDENIEKLRDPLTPTSFAIHELIYFKMREIIEHIRPRLNEIDQESGHIPTPPQQLEIASCMRSLMEVLQKSRNYTVDGLRQDARGDRTVIAEVLREIMEYVLPQARRPLATTVWNAMQEALSDEALMELQYKMLDIADKAYNHQDPVDKSLFEAVDKGISDCTDELLDMMIQTILNDKLDTNNVRQQLEISTFTNTFRNQLQSFLGNIARHHMQISIPATSHAAKAAAVSEMCTNMRKFLYEDVEALGKASINSYLHQGTISQFNELLGQLKEYLEPMRQKIKSMKDIQEEIAGYEMSANAYVEARKALGLIEFSLCHTYLSPTDLAQAARALAELEQHMETLSTHSPFDNRAVISQYAQLKDMYAKLLSTHSHISLLLRIQSHWNAFITLKQDPHPNTLHIGQAYRSLMELVSYLPQKEQLSSPLSNILSSPSDTTVQLASTFNLALENQLRTMETHLENTRAQMTGSKQTMNFHFNKEIQARETIQQKREALLEKNRELTQDLCTIRRWEQSVRDMTIINVNIIPFMKWVQDTVHSLALTQTKAVVAEIREVLLLPHFYSCIINQMGVRFLELYGKEHITQT